MILRTVILHIIMLTFAIKPSTKKVCPWNSIFTCPGMFWHVWNLGIGNIRVSKQWTVHVLNVLKYNVAVTQTLLDHDKVTEIQISLCSMYYIFENVLIMAWFVAKTHSADIHTDEIMQYIVHRIHSYVYGCLLFVSGYLHAFKVWVS